MVSADAINFPKHVRVAIVGAGPAGLGLARVLKDLAVPDVFVFERGKIGDSFRNWPEETRLLTPSFPGNVFGITDLNAISYDSSPGWSLRSEHPNGREYADYLESAAHAFELDVRCDVEIQSIRPEANLFHIQTNRGSLTADYVVWACGHFGEPSTDGIPGAELGQHYGSIRSWHDVTSHEVFIIGGYESGIDAAIGLAGQGKEVTVIDRGAPWLSTDKDPSRSLSPYTQQRLDSFSGYESLNLIPNTEIIALEKAAEGVQILSNDGRSWHSKTAPVFATGFGSGTAKVSDWFEYDQDGSPELTLQDESTITPGLFLVGPEVSHNGHLFCFIYKFRQRFGVVAHTIAERMGVDTMPLMAYRENNMLLDDLACCDDDKCFC